MATYGLIPGATSDSWYWHRVEPRLRAAGHDVVAVDLPCDDDRAGLEAYTDTVVGAVGTCGDLVLVAQSMGGLTAPLVAARVPTRLVVLVAAMIPRPGESGAEWWERTGHDEARRAAAEGRPWSADDEDPTTMFLHDVPSDVVAASAAHVHDQSATPFATPWPLEAWPDVPTRVIACRDDRFFPLEFQRRVARERLGVEPDVIPGGHLCALAQPDALVARLEDYRVELGIP